MAITGIAAAAAILRTQSMVLVHKQACTSASPPHLHHITTPAAAAAAVGGGDVVAVLNVLGFACYTQFNLSLFLSPVVRGEYMQRFGTTDVPVELNDVVFGLHALIMSLVLAIQCVVYPKHDTQSVSLGTTLGISGATAAAGTMAIYLAVAGEAAWPFTWLDL